jgi:hypothetical protein
MAPSQKTAAIASKDKANLFENDCDFSKVIS